jgi:YidC/Oxa1 family membrane protein insertase
MDKNQVIGFLLIGALLLGYMFYMQPSDEEIAKQKAKYDSVMALKADSARMALAAQDTVSASITSNSNDPVVNNTPIANGNTTSLNTNSDSIQNAKLDRLYGEFAVSATPIEEYYTIENEHLRLKIASKGGRMVSAELKQYQTYDSLPLYLFDEDSSQFNVSFYYDGRTAIRTEELYFKPKSKEFVISGEDSKSFSMVLETADPNRNLEFVYTLRGNDYIIDFDIKSNGFEELARSTVSPLDLSWQMKALTKERGIDAERQKTTMFFKYKNEDTDYISETKSEKINLIATSDWISFKQQFFSAVLISPDGLDKQNAYVESQDLTDKSNRYTKELSAMVTLPLAAGNASPTANLKMYLGPNHFQTLKDIGIELEDQIDLGWGIFGWVNEFIVIPIFNFLDGFNMNYGIIILILTLFIKLILFPLTYKTYKSSAKMRVLKPEIDALNEKHKDDDPLKKQQATMGLYRQAGVNPMAGCIPMIIQMPILYAMFRFFPASIELRQESFLWAEDLSTYDSIASLPFDVPYYGDHVSLFTLLMAISTFLYSKFNTQMTAASGPQASQMKIMLYFMPVMLLFFFNGYASGLSYYYFTANIISVVQQVVIKKWFINEEAILAKIEKNRKNPKKKKKSSFQQRLEKMAKERGVEPPNQKKKKK